MLTSVIDQGDCGRGVVMVLVVGVEVVVCDDAKYEAAHEQSMSAFAPANTQKKAIEVA